MVQFNLYRSIFIHVRIHHSQVRPDEGADAPKYSHVSIHFSARLAIVITILFSIKLTHADLKAELNQIKIYNL